MTIENKALVLDLVEWIARQPRPYSEVMDVWRTSCPRLPIWEDAIDMGLIVLAHGDASGTVVKITRAGRAFLESARPACRDGMA